LLLLLLLLLLPLLLLLLLLAGKRVGISDRRKLEPVLLSTSSRDGLAPLPRRPSRRRPSLSDGYCSSLGRRGVPSSIDILSIRRVRSARRRPSSRFRIRHRLRLSFTRRRRALGIGGGRGVVQLLMLLLLLLGEAVGGGERPVLKRREVGLRVVRRGGEGGLRLLRRRLRIMRARDRHEGFSSILGGVVLVLFFLFNRDKDTTGDSA
jgi:hypothetical protein